MPTVVRYRYVYEDVDRHGNVRLYFWRGRGHPKQRLHDAPGTQAFSRRYHELLATAGERAATQRIDLASRAGTLGWLVELYRRSGAFRGLDPATQRQRVLLLEGCMREPLRPGTAMTFAALPVDRLTLQAMEVLRDRKRAMPGAAQNRVKALRGLLAWAGSEGHVAGAIADLRHRLARPRHTSAGHHTWTPEEIAAFEAAHPLGTRARLALAILLWTGVRRSDAVRLGRQHVREGWITIRQHKGRNRHPTTLEIPLLPELERTLAASRLGDLTWLVTEAGQPFSAAGFGNWFRRCCSAAGLPHCSAHGLRKAGATLAAERGATAHQLMALYGWRHLAEAEGYTRRADRRRLAAEAGRHLAGTVADLHHSAGDTFPPPAAVGKRRRK